MKKKLFPQNAVESMRQEAGNYAAGMCLVS